MLAAVLVVCAYLGWREHDFRSAIDEASRRGWLVEYADPLKTVRANWKAAFSAETWFDRRRKVKIGTWLDREKDRRLLRRLAPRHLVIVRTNELEDLSSFAPLSSLEGLSIYYGSQLTSVDGVGALPRLKMFELSNCPNLTNIDALSGLRELRDLFIHRAKNLPNVDALQSLPSLAYLKLRECRKLTNVDAVTSLEGPSGLDISGCSALSKEYVDALRKAMPATGIAWDRISE